MYIFSKRPRSPLALSTWSNYSIPVPASLHALIRLINEVIPQIPSRFWLKLWTYLTPWALYHNCSKWTPTKGGWKESQALKLTKKAHNDGFLDYRCRQRTNLQYQDIQMWCDVLKLLLRKSIPIFNTKIWRFFLSGGIYKNNNFQSKLITMFLNVFFSFRITHP